MRFIMILHNALHLGHMDSENVRYARVGGAFFGSVRHFTCKPEKLKKKNFTSPVGQENSKNQCQGQLRFLKEQYASLSVGERNSKNLAKARPLYL